MAVASNVAWTDDGNRGARVTGNCDPRHYVGVDYGTVSGVYTHSSLQFKLLASTTDKPGPALSSTASFTIFVPDPLYGSQTLASGTYYYRLWGAMPGDHRGGYIDIERTGTISSARVALPVTAALRLEGKAPTVFTRAPQSMTVPVRALLLQGLAPTVLTGPAHGRIPQTSALLLTGKAPTVSQNIRITPSTGALVLRGNTLASEWEILGVAAVPSTAPSTPLNEVAFICATSVNTWAGVEVWTDDYDLRLSILDTEFTSLHSFTGDMATLDAGVTYNWQFVAWTVATPDEFLGTPVDPQSELGTPFTVDLEAPTVTGQTVINITNEGAIPVFTTDQDAGTAYVVMVANGDSPSAAQIKLGQDSSSAAAVDASNQAVTQADDPQIMTQLTGGDADEDYDIWIVHTNIVGNDSTPVKYDLRTAATAPLSLDGSLQYALTASASSRSTSHSTTGVDRLMVAIVEATGAGVDPTPVSVSSSTLGTWIALAQTHQPSPQSVIEIWCQWAPTALTSEVITASWSGNQSAMLTTLAIVGSRDYAGLVAGTDFAVSESYGNEAGVTTVTSGAVTAVGLASWLLQGCYANSTYGLTANSDCTVINENHTYMTFGNQRLTYSTTPGEDYTVGGTSYAFGWAQATAEILLPDPSPVIELIGSGVAASSTNTTSVTTGTYDTSGADFIAVVVSWYIYDGGTITVTDNKGNGSATLKHQAAGDGTYGQSIYYWENLTGGDIGAGHTFTVTGGGGGAGVVYPAVAVLAFSGVSAAADDTGIASDSLNGPAVTIVGTGYVTPSADGGLLIVGLLSDTARASSVAIDSGFTIAGNQDYSGGFAFGVTAAYKIQTTATTENAAWTWTGAGVGVTTIGAFKKA